MDVISVSSTIWGASGTVVGAVMDDMEDIDLQSSGCPSWSTLEGKKLVSKNEESPPFKVPIGPGL